MSQRARTVLAVAVLLAVAGGLALWAWLPFDPFEGTAGRLDGLVPEDADAAFRCDGAALLAAPAALALWDDEVLADLRAALGLEDGVASAVRRVETSFARRVEPFAAPPTLARDLVPAEVVVATRGGEVLVLSRISSRARAIELLRREDEPTLRSLGIRIDGRCVALLGPDGEPRLWASRHRDVLVAGTSREIVSQALTLGETGSGGLATLLDFNDALGLGGPEPAVGARVLGWATARALRRWTEPVGDAPWRGVLAADAKSGPLRISADLGDRARIRIETSIEWTGGDAPAIVTAFEDAEAANVSYPAMGDLLGGGAGAVVAGGLRVRASDVLEALLRSAPPEVEEAADEAFAAAGTTPATVAQALAAHLEDGIAVAVVRLPEADLLAAGDGEPGAVHAIPGTVVGFRLRAGALGAAALEAEIRRRAEAILGEPLADDVAEVAPGVRVHALPRHGLAGHWELLRPAFAFAGEWFVVSSHEGHLRRVLAAPLPGGSATTEGTSLRIGAAALRRLVEDRRWEEADRATVHDWPAERREIEAAAQRLSSLRPGDRADYVDARMRERAARRRREEIPRAAAEWQRRWRWLAAFEGVRLDGDVTGRTARLRIEIALAE